MALKAMMDSIDTLPDPIKAEYSKGEDGKFYLAIEDFDSHPSVGALKRAKDYEKKERQALTAKMEEANQQLAALTAEREDFLRGAIPKGDVEKLEASYKGKLTKLENEFGAENATLKANLNNILVDNVALQLASKLSDSPDLLLPHIRPRLRAEIVDGKATTRVVDKDNSLSALTVEDLEKEIGANPIFAPIIKGSKASGGGASGKSPARATSGGGTRPMLVSMSGKDLVAALDAKYNN